MKTPKSFIGIVIALFFLGGAAYYWRKMLEKGELGEKSGYALLQGIESDHRGDSEKSRPMIYPDFDHSGFDVIGLPTEDEIYPRIWAIANQTAPDGAVMILPKELKDRIKCADVRAVQDRVKLNNRVASLLKSGCRE